MCGMQMLKDYANHFVKQLQKSLDNVLNAHSIWTFSNNMNLTHGFDVEWTVAAA